MRCGSPTPAPTDLSGAERRGRAAALASWDLADARFMGCSGWRRIFVTVRRYVGLALRALIGKFIRFMLSGCWSALGGRSPSHSFETLSFGMVSYGLDKARRSRCGSRS